MELEILFVIQIDNGEFSNYYLKIPNKNWMLGFVLRRLVTRSHREGSQQDSCSLCTFVCIYHLEKPQKQEA